MFIALLVLMVVLMALVILLPTLSGLFTYSQNPTYIEKRKMKEQQKIQSHDKQDFGYDSYVPPDEQELFEEEKPEHKLKALGTGFYSKINKLTPDDIPIKLQLQNQELKKRNTKSNGAAQLDSNPNNYDYDLNELIDEELKNDKEELKKPVSGFNEFREV